MKTRKSLLISSVAMLLVAMLALGTATFAWFTQSTTSKAQGINVSTVKSSQLQISKIDKVWGTKIDYALKDEIYFPVSSADGSAWYTTYASSSDSYEADTEIDATKLTSASDYFVNQLNVKNNGTADMKDVKITFSLEDTIKPEYVRVALVPVTDTEDNTNQVVAPDSDDFVASIYAEDNTPYKALTGKDVDADLSADITPKTTYTVKVGTDDAQNESVLTAGEIKYYNLYVWFEGQDEDCKDTNSGASLGDIQFSVTGEIIE